MGKNEEILNIGSNLRAEPEKGKPLRDCDLHHTTDIPGIGLVDGELDPRGRIEEILDQKK